MKIGFLFPGQGAQSIGMGKDLYEKYEEYKKVYDDVRIVTGVNVADLTFNSTEEILGKTQNTQICILTMSLAILKLLEEKGITAEASIGLSLGEYSALASSNAISLEDAVKIVKIRGELMQNFCPRGNWSMAAILGLDEETVTKVCSETQGFVVPANFNCPGQIVISGEKESVDKAMDSMKNAGAKRALELKTSGPFHTEKLEIASNELRKELDKISINNFKHTVIKNLDGKEYTKADDVKDILAKHITNSVRFEQGIKTMLNMGIDTFIEIGPGKTLTGFVKKANKDVKTYNINNVESLENVLAELV